MTDDELTVIAAAMLREEVEWISDPFRCPKFEIEAACKRFTDRWCGIADAAIPIVVQFRSITYKPSPRPPIIYHPSPAGVACPFHSTFLIDNTHPNPHQHYSHQPASTLAITPYPTAPRINTTHTAQSLLIITTAYPTPYTPPAYPTLIPIPSLTCPPPLTPFAEKVLLRGV